MGTRLVPILVSWVVVALCGPGPRLAEAQQLPEALQAFLRQRMLLDAGDLSSLNSGDAVTTLPAARDPREIGGFAAVRVSAPTTALTAALGDIETYVRGDHARPVGRFSDPPQLSDVRALTLPPGDLDALRRCRVGDCGVKLSTAMMERFRRDVAWDAPDWRERATALYREMLVEYVAAYLRRGPDALAEYTDRTTAVALAAETRSLLAETPYVQGVAPELFEQLGRTASAPLPGLRRVLYWSVEHYGYKPTITISEVAIYASEKAAATFVVATQLYASHYFEGSVVLTVATTAGARSAAPSSLLMYLHRSRLDGLRGGFLGLKRFAAGRRIRGRVEDTVLRVKARLEAAGTATTGAAQGGGIGKP